MLLQNHASALSARMIQIIKVLKGMWARTSRHENESYEVNCIKQIKPREPHEGGGARDASQQYACGTFQP